MATITIDPLHSSVFENQKFFFDSVNDWVGRYSHPFQTAGGEEPSVYVPGTGGTSGILTFGWVPYDIENFPSSYFPIFGNEPGALVREVHIVTGEALGAFDENSKILSDILVVEWSIDGGKTTSQFQVEKVEVSTGQSIPQFYDQQLSEFLIGNDEVNGSKGADSINGYTGNDDLKGLEGNDLLAGGIGNDFIDGGSGVDVAVFVGSRSQYVINTLNGTVSDGIVNRDGVDVLTSVERLQFADVTVALDNHSSQTAGAVYMLYQATFNRKPDATGLGYWINAVDKGADITKDVAAFFVKSGEFAAKYGSNPTNASYVDNLYLNVLHRPGEAGGIAYWNKALNDGVVTKAAVLEAFATLPEGASLVAADIASGIAYTHWVG